MPSSLSLTRIDRRSPAQIFEELCAKHDIMVLSMDYRYHGNSTAGKGAEPPSGYFHTCACAPPRLSS